MDLNRKYADHQIEVMRASAGRQRGDRTTHAENAVQIAEQISQYQARLGAAASCAWSATKMDTAGRKIPAWSWAMKAA